MEKTKSEKLRILVIDDSPSILEDYRKILESSSSEKKDAFSALDKELFEEDAPDLSISNRNSELDLLTYEVSYADQGKKGLEYVEQSLKENRPYALMFVDIRMPPGWDGIETIQHIWKIDPWIQTVISTAYSDYSWVDIIKLLGKTDNLILLKKPFEIIEVRQLASALTKKWQLNNEVKNHINDLEAMIKQRTKELEKSLNLVRNTLESTADGILVVDEKGKILDFNKKWVDMWRVPSSILEAKLMSDVLPFLFDKLQDPEAFSFRINYLQKNKDAEDINELRFKDGRFFEQYSKPFQVEDKNIGRVWSFRDITEQKKMQEAILYQATHDKLTKLPNRRLLNDRIKQQIALAKRNKSLVAILFLDLDRFKLVNDCFGHAAGDLVLKLFSKRVTSIIRENDTFSRIGGDEFVLVFTGATNEEQIKIVVNKILNIVKTPFVLNKNDFFLTVSIGISVCPKDSVNVEELLQKADAAMYAAKKSGRNTFKFCEENESGRMLQLLTLENDLRRAIENNELILYYQPLIEVLSHMVVGMEALIRWKHPKFGLLLPDAFLPIAEETGLIIPIGEWALRTACAQNKAWQDNNFLALKVAVNISSTQLKYPQFDIVVERILKETRLEPQYLELELTESTLIEEPSKIMKVLENIKKLGVDLVIDDFGTGYSSLNYIKSFHFDKLKIDRTFVKDVNTDVDDSKLVESIINMAENLNLKVVAEGIEKKEQLAFFDKNKCNQIQGYLLSKPVTAQDFTEILKANKKLF